MKRIALLGDLIKYRLSVAVTLSAATGYSIYDSHAGLSLIFLIAGIFLLSSGSAALNQYTEWKSDAMMVRTMNRPIPGQYMRKEKALFVSFVLILLGFSSLLITGVVPALLGLLTLFLYNVVYTRLKKVSSLAIIPGALVGAIPPVIGFTSAGGMNPDGGIIMFASFMFLWQLPHFWLILIRYKNDYLAAGFKNLTGNLPMKQVRILVFLWVVFSSLLLSFFTASGMVFSRPLNLIIIPLNIVFISLFYIFLFRIDEKKSFRDTFILINSFSLAIMLLFIANSFLN